MTISAALAIDTQGLRKEYKGVTALHGLNLRVSRHAICGFLGPNGAGKSTAIKLPVGLTTLAPAPLLGRPLPSLLPIATALLAIAIFIGLAIWCFARQDL